MLHGASFNWSYFYYCFTALRDLHSFPTRRSSDLEVVQAHERARHRAAAPPQRGHRAGDEGRPRAALAEAARQHGAEDRKSTRLNSSHVEISYAVFCLKKKKKNLDVG